MSSKPKPPASLTVEGQELWCAVVETYDLRADELRVLANACGAADMLAEFLKAWNDLGRPYMSKGSMGQEVEHPLIGSIDKQRKALAAFVRQLNLPDDDSGAAVNQHRDAANTKWSRRGA